MAKPNLQRIPAYYHSYINNVKTDDLAAAFKQHQTDLTSFLTQLPDEKWNYRYAEGKWSVKEMVQHIIDTDRIFNYRALCIARGEQASLPGFDENSYAAASKAGRRTKEDLLEELRTVQASSALLFNSFDEEQLDRTGVANNNPTYVLGIGFILIGHALHHKNILQERYL
jgi:uncharacterized damage-inducible protein DinB